jgi:hypothetical protein
MDSNPPGRDAMSRDYGLFEGPWSLDMSSRAKQSQDELKEVQIIRKLENHLHDTVISWKTRAFN